MSPKGAPEALPEPRVQKRDKSALPLSSAPQVRQYRLVCARFTPREGGQSYRKAKGTFRKALFTVSPDLRGRGCQPESWPATSKQLPCSTCCCCIILPSPKEGRYWTSRSGDGKDPAVPVRPWPPRPPGTTGSRCGSTFLLQRAEVESLAPQADLRRGRFCGVPRVMSHRSDKKYPRPAPRGSFLRRAQEAQPTCDGPELLARPRADVRSTLRPVRSATTTKSRLVPPARYVQPVWGPHWSGVWASRSFSDAVHKSRRVFPPTTDGQRGSPRCSCRGTQQAARYLNRGLPTGTKFSERPLVRFHVDKEGRIERHPRGRWNVRGGGGKRRPTPRLGHHEHRTEPSDPEDETMSDGKFR